MARADMASKPSLLGALTMGAPFIRYRGPCTLAQARPTARASSVASVLFASLAGELGWHAQKHAIYK